MLWAEDVVEPAAPVPTEHKAEEDTDDAADRQAAPRRRSAIEGQEAAEQGRKAGTKKASDRISQSVFMSPSILRVRRTGAASATSRCHYFWEPLKGKFILALLFLKGFLKRTLLLPDVDWVV